MPQLPTRTPAMPMKARKTMKVPDRKTMLTVSWAGGSQRNPMGRVPIHVTGPSGRELRKPAIDPSVHPRCL